MEKGRGKDGKNTSTNWLEKVVLRNFETIDSICDGTTRRKRNGTLSNLEITNEYIFKEIM